MSSTPETTARGLILVAVRAGRHEVPLDESLAADIADGRDVALDRLNFDSLGWMEFCISIEANSAQELSPAHLAEMRSLRDVEDWLLARLPA